MTINLAQKSIVFFAVLSPFRRRFLSRQNMLTLIQCELLADAVLPESVMYSIFSTTHHQLWRHLMQSGYPEIYKKLLLW